MQTTTTSTTAPPSEGTEVLSSFLWFHQDRYWNEVRYTTLGLLLLRGYLMMVMKVWLTLELLLVVPGGPPAPASAPITGQAADHRHGALEDGNDSQDDHEEENETEQQEGDAGRNHNDNTNDHTQDAHPRISSFNPAGSLLHPVVAHLRFFSRVLASSFFASTADIVAFISVFAQLFRELSAPLHVWKRASRSASRHVHSGVTQLIII
jgi:hypothetical protein